MKANRNLVLATLTAALAFGAAASTASADSTTLTVDFTVNAAPDSTLTVATASSTKTLSSATFSSGSTSSLDGDVPELTLTDGRGSLSAWTLSVEATDFATGGPAASNAVIYLPVDATGQAAGAVLTAFLAGVGTPGLVENANLMIMNSCYCVATGALAEAALGTTHLGSSYTLATGVATGLTSDASIELNPDIRVRVPAATPPGNYTSTVTYTLS